MYDKQTFMAFVEATDIRRKYQKTLYTFGDVNLPYMFVSKPLSGKDISVM